MKPDKEDPRTEKSVTEDLLDEIGCYLHPSMRSRLREAEKRLDDGSFEAGYAHDMWFLANQLAQKEREYRQADQDRKNWFDAYNTTRNTVERVLMSIERKLGWG